VQSRAGCFATDAVFNDGVGRGSAGCLQQAQLWAAGWGCCATCPRAYHLQLLLLIEAHRWTVGLVLQVQPTRKQQLLLSRSSSWVLLVEKTQAALGNQEHMHGVSLVARPVLVIHAPVPLFSARSMSLLSQQMDVSLLSLPDLQ
jgi:hypothetical protein